MVTVQDVRERWEQIQGDDERILFIVGGPGSGKNSSSISCFASKYFHPFCSDNSRINKLLPEPGPPTINNMRSIITLNLFPTFSYILNCNHIPCLLAVTVPT